MAGSLPSVGEGSRTAWLCRALRGWLWSLLGGSQLLGSCVLPQGDVTSRCRSEGRGCAGQWL